MRRWALLLALLFCGTAPAWAGQRLALVIGNGAYGRLPPVARARPDADAVSATLKDAGFTVIEKRETDGAGLKKALKNLAVAFTGDDDVVIYFSGHAVNLGGEDYLLPVDVGAEGEEAVKGAGVALKGVLADLQEAKPHMLLLMVDASRPTPFSPAIGATGLAAVSANPRQVILFAAAEGKVAPDSLGKDDLRQFSPFVRVLVKEIARPGLALPGMLDGLKAGVSAQAQAAGQEQAPAVFGQAPTDFQFRLAGAGPADNLARLLAAEERQAWEAADGQRQEAAYKAFLKSFADGGLATKARERLDDLALWDKARDGEMEPLRKYVSAHPDGLFMQKARALLDEGELWEKARSQSDTALLRDYLGRYPQGRFATPAGSLLARLDAEAAAKRDEDDWNAAKAANTTVGFETYLKAHPDGRFAAQARETIEQIAWDAAQKGAGEASYDDYLKRYPRGRFAQAAKDNTEQIIWGKAQKARTLDLTRLYLQRYPQGRFAAQAGEQEEDIIWDEARACDAADQSGDIYRCDSLADAFVQRYGSGRHGAEAKALQEGLQASKPERTERRALADAVKSGSTDQLQAVLDHFPNGHHYAETMEKLTELWRSKQALPMTGTPFRDAFQGGSGPEMIALPAGKFTMGGDETLPEKPAHAVFIVRPFALGKYEVSFDDWDACVADKGCAYRPDDEVSVLLFRWKGRGRMPAINLNWSDVQQYLTWLGAKTGKKYRLPTESEWEYAARAGTTSRYYFGAGDADLAKHAWYTGNAQRQAHAVGELAASPAGFHDIYGNVAEWTQDCWHSNYENAPANGSVAWTSNCIGSAHVTRGGYFFDTASNVRSASRGRVGDTMRSPGVGFRVARDYP